MLRVPGAQGFAFLAKDLPGFRLSGSQVGFSWRMLMIRRKVTCTYQVQVIHEPSHFYEQLLKRSATAKKVEFHPSLLDLVTSTCSASGPLCAVPWSGAQGGRAGLQAARQPCLQPPAEGQLPPGLLSRQVRTMLFCFIRPLQSDGSWQLLLHPGVPLARRRRRRKVQRSLLPHTQAQGSSQVETLNNKNKN